MSSSISTVDTDESSRLARRSGYATTNQRAAGTPLSIWIVCPCYLDCKSFLRVRDEALAVLKASLPLATARFVLVDDTAGNDPEVADLRQFDDVRIITPPYNLGHQGALVYGLRALESTVQADDFIVTMDSDGEDRPANLPQMLAPLLAGRDNLRLVSVAMRTRRQEGFKFKLLYTCFKAFFWALTGIVMRSGNFVAYRGILLKDSIFHPHFDQCYSSTFVSTPFQVRAVPLPKGNRYHGNSRMTFIGLIIHGIRMVMPFSERVAIRSMIFSAAVIATSLLAWIWLWLTGRSVSVAAMAVALGLLVLMLSGFLFTWHSHARSITLRALHEYPHRR